MKEIMREITQYHNRYLLCLSLALVFWIVTFIVYIRWEISKTIAFFTKKNRKYKEETDEKSFQMVTEKLCDNDATVLLWRDE